MSPNLVRQSKSQSANIPRSPGISQGPSRSTIAGTRVATPRARAAGGGLRLDSRCWEFARNSLSASDSPRIEFRPRSCAVEFQRAFFTDRVGTLEDPVLPSRQTGKYFRLERLRPAESQRRFHAGQRVRRKGRAFFDSETNLVVPVDIVRREGHEAQPIRLRRIDLLANPAAQLLDVLRFALKSACQPSQAVAHRHRAKVHFRQPDIRRQ